MAEEAKITLDVSSDELSRRVNAIPDIEDEIANLLKDLPATVKKEGLLNNIREEVGQNTTIVSNFDGRIKDVETRSTTNQTNITNLESDLGSTNKKLGNLQEQVFGDEAQSSTTIVSRINNKVEASVYSNYTTNTDKTLSNLSGDIGKLQTKDIELKKDIDKNAADIKSINEILDGDGTDSNPGLIQLGREIFALKNNNYTNETNISSIQMTLGNVVSRLEFVEQQLGIPTGTENNIQVQKVLKSWANLSK